MKPSIKFRASSMGKLMTEPRSKSEGPLSVGAKTYIRKLVAQDIFGVEFEIGGKQLEKGIRCEDQGIALLNRVRGLSLTKNTERREDEHFTGEADLFDASRRRGHDLKCPWSAATFPIALADCYDKDYEWQMRTYMALWDADEWEVDYTLVNTPDDLIGYESHDMHIVDHVPERMRLTAWVIPRDRSLEDAMREKTRHAAAYYAEVLAEFDRTHGAALVAAATATTQAASTAPADLPESIF